MLKKKVLLFGLLIIVTTLLANMTMGNMDSESLGCERGLAVSDSELLSDPDYIVIRGNDDEIYLVPQSSLEDILEVTEDGEEESEEEMEGFIDFDKLDEEVAKEIKRFSSFEELRDYLGYSQNKSDNDSDGTRDSNEMFYRVTVKSSPTAFSGTIAAGDSIISSVSDPDYSTTNVQVIGVDEGDIIKNDDKYVYIVSKDLKSVEIALVYPAIDAKILSTIEVEGTIREIYVSNDKLVVVFYKSTYSGLSYKYGGIYYGGYYSAYNYYETYINIYDIEDRSFPDLDASHSCQGSFQQSRLIGDFVYIITQWNMNSQITESGLPVPVSDIYYFCDSDEETGYYYEPLTIITAVNIQEPTSNPTRTALLFRSSTNIYVSSKNIYISYSKYYYYDSSNEQMTAVHRIAIQNGQIHYMALGKVPGRILNRFSMDEFDGHFRVATTTGQVSRTGVGTARNHVYVLNLDLKIVGSINDIAPGERIYSARFMGNRGYLVTFDKVDPFFVIDLKNPTKPKILGELKIPGYSDYLHPYDENHVIGLGKDTVLAESGSFSWFQGVKLSLFDVTDVNNPKEVSKYIIGDRGTSSPALTDPHAFLFSMDKNLLVIPIQLYEIDESKYDGEIPANAYGDYKWSGVYVFHISAEKGFALRGGISHSDDKENEDQYGYYWRNNDDAIKRSFYIDNVLYTLSNNKLGMNDLDDLSEINHLNLSDA